MIWAVLACGFASGFAMASGLFDRIVRRDPLWWRGVLFGTVFLASALGFALWSR